MSDGLKLGVLGIDHGHIFGMLTNMKAEGCVCAHYWTDGPAVTEAKFNEVFPEIAKVADRRMILEDTSVDMILISAVPGDRARLAIEAMEAGKDVMVDKPGVTTLSDLAALQDAQFFRTLSGAGRNSRRSPGFWRSDRACGANDWDRAA